MSFLTRQTLSSDMPASDGKGATAAAEWIKSEFERYSRECGGCLEVKTDELFRRRDRGSQSRQRSPMFMRFSARDRSGQCRAYGPASGTTIREQRHQRRHRARAGRQR